jgi:hypothetical protein
MSSITGLDNTLQCTVCSEYYNTTQRLPKLFHCGHTYCLTCVRQLFRQASIQSNDNNNNNNNSNNRSRNNQNNNQNNKNRERPSINCPLCRKNQYIYPPAEKLPTNIAFLDLINALAKYKVEEMKENKQKTQEMRAQALQIQKLEQKNAQEMNMQALQMHKLEQEKAQQIQKIEQEIIMKAQEKLKKMSIFERNMLAAEKLKVNCDLCIEGDDTVYGYDARRIAISRCHHCYLHLCRSHTDIHERSKSTKVHRIEYSIQPVQTGKQEKDTKWWPFS